MKKRGETLGGLDQFIKDAIQYHEDRGWPWEDKRDPDRLREDQEERRRLEKEYPDPDT